MFVCGGRFGGISGTDAAGRFRPDGHGRRPGRDQGVTYEHQTSLVISFKIRTKSDMCVILMALPPLLAFVRVRAAMGLYTIGESV